MSEDLHKQLFEEGIKMRRRVMGDAFVDKALASGVSEFSRPIQEYVTETAWGIWGRDGLELRHRSMINLAMLTALNRSTELAGHVRGAINNGVTEVEIREVLLEVRSAK